MPGTVAIMSSRLLPWYINTSTPCRLTRAGSPKERTLPDSLRFLRKSPPIAGWGNAFLGVS